MKKIFLGLGSNVGDKEKNIKEAIKLLSTKIFNIKTSKFYISQPVGIENQPTFINAVICGYTQLSPFELLAFTKKVEKKVGRIYRYRWGPREIDIDILFYEDLVIQSKSLIIPHPRLHERDFVLKPLKDLEPEFIHPTLKKSIAELYSQLKEFSIKQ